MPLAGEPFLNELVRAGICCLSLLSGMEKTTKLLQTADNCSSFWVFRDIPELAGGSRFTLFFPLLCLSISISSISSAAHPLFFHCFFILPFILSISSLLFLSVLLKRDQIIMIRKRLECEKCTASTSLTCILLWNPPAWFLFKPSEVGRTVFC